MELNILSTPVTDGQPVQGVCEGRMIAYWPTDQEKGAGVSNPAGGYIPARVKYRPLKETAE